MLKTYPAIFHVAEEGGYWVTFPDFGGATEGDTLDEAVAMAKDCLATLIASYIDDEIELPEPTPMTSIPYEEGQFASLVQCDPAPYIRGNKAVRTNITVPEWVLKRAKQAKINVSETATEALINQLNL